jgi:PTH1 family peptidyl-tRNA hydrolase
VKIVVGLGNPGPEYAHTRHNIGFMVIDRLAALYAPGAVARQRFQSMTIEATLPQRSPRDWDEREGRWSSEPPATNRVLLVKPMTYMNLSGRAVAEALRFYKLDPQSDLLVVVDEIALPCGTIRLRSQGSAGGHNGLADIERLLGTDRYDRMRIGIDAPGRIPQRDYVLGRFTDEQLPAVQSSIERAVAAIQLWASAGVTPAGNVFHVKKPPRPHRPGPAERAGQARAQAAAPGSERADPSRNQPASHPDSQIHPEDPSANASASPAERSAD